jgi:DNA topoisomerase IA
VKSIVENVKKQTTATFLWEKSTKKIIKKPDPLNFIGFLMKASRLLDLNLLEVIFLSNVLYENGYISYYFSKNLKFKDRKIVKNTIKLLQEDPEFHDEAEFLLENSDTKNLKFQDANDSSYLPPIIPVQKRDKSIDSLGEKAEKLYILIAHCFFASLHDDLKITEIERKFKVDSQNFSVVSNQSCAIWTENPMLNDG